MKTRGMLLLLFCMLLGALGAVAAPWGASQDYTDQTNGKPIGDDYLLKRSLEGKPIRVYVNVANGSKEDTQRYAQMVKEAYAGWFANAAQQIEKQKRTEEFKDVLPTLKKGIAVEMVNNPREADVQVNAVAGAKELSEKCGEGTGGCTGQAGGKHGVWVKKDFDAATLQHELGHTLGLSDQYKGLDGQRDRSTHRQYSSLEDRKSIMNQSRSLKCDDADGIVNLMDITRGASRGGKKGWKSLCKKSKEYYVQGRPMGKGPYGVETRGEREIVLTDYSQGTPRQKVLAFDTSRKGSSFQAPVVSHVIQRDSLDRPVRAAGTRGENIYYDYGYDTTKQVVVHNNKAMYYQADFVNRPERGKKTSTDRVVAVGDGGSIKWLLGRGESSVSLKELRADGTVRGATYNYDKSQKMINQDFYDDYDKMRQKGVKIKNQVSPEQQKENQAREQEQMKNWLFKNK